MIVDVKKLSLSKIFNAGLGNNTHQKIQSYYIMTKNAPIFSGRKNYVVERHSFRKLMLHIFTSSLLLQCDATDHLPVQIRRSSPLKNTWLQKRADKSEPMAKRFATGPSNHHLQSNGDASTRHPGLTAMVVKPQQNIQWRKPQAESYTSISIPCSICFLGKSPQLS